MNGTYIPDLIDVIPPLRLGPSNVLLDEACARPMLTIIVRVRSIVCGTFSGPPRLRARGYLGTLGSKYSIYDSQQIGDTRVRYGYLLYLVSMD